MKVAEDELSLGREELQAVKGDLWATMINLHWPLPMGRGPNMSSPHCWKGQGLVTIVSGSDGR